MLTGNRGCLAMLYAIQSPSRILNGRLRTSGNTVSHMVSFPYSNRGIMDVLPYCKLYHLVPVPLRPPASPKATRSFAGARVPPSCGIQQKYWYRTGVQCVGGGEGKETEGGGESYVREGEEERGESERKGGGAGFVFEGGGGGGGGGGQGRGGLM